MILARFTGVVLLVILPLTDAATTTSEPQVQTTGTKTCNLTIWYLGGNVTNKTVNVLSGDIVNLMCDARCSHSNYPPKLKWFDPDLMVVKDIPGLRVFSSPMTSQRIQNMYIQGFSQDDAGRYICRGYIGYWDTAHVTIDFESEAKEFRDLNPRSF